MDEQWESVVRPLLSGIRYDAHWVKHYCNAIREKVTRLPNQPPFETEAAAELSAATVLLREAHGALNEARHNFLDKPLEPLSGRDK